MTAGSTSVWRSALVRLSAGFVLQQIGLALLVFALSVLWLRVPDASALDVMGSVVLGLVVLAVAGMGESWLLLRLAGRERTRIKLLRGMLSMLAGVGLWWGWSALIDHLQGYDSLWAGYLNSRFPHALRNILSYRHIDLWLGWTWTALEWIGVGVVAIFVFAATASRRPIRGVISALSCATYWVALILGTACATVITGSVMGWTPGHGLGIEMVSLVLRLSATVLVDAAVVSLLLAILAVCVQRGDIGYETPAGTPVESQPRIVEEP